MSGSGQGPGGTVFRPNPGLRLPEQGKPAATEDWISAAPTPPALQPGVRVAVIRGGALSSPNENPIMGAAAPVLLVLGQLRVGMLRAPFAQLMELVANAIQDFDETVTEAGVPQPQIRMAKYVLCATADDIVQHIPNEERHVWTQFSMLSRFFGERLGGQGFFDEVERAKADPMINVFLLEFEHACLALGFQGKYRTMPGGVAMLQQEQRVLYETLRRVKGRPVEEWSPRWQGQQTIIKNRKPLVPLWAAFAGAAVLCLAAYAGLSLALAGRSEASAEAITGLHPKGMIALERRVPVPPPPPPPPPVTKPTGPSIQDVASGTVAVEETGDRVKLTIAGTALFDSGEAKLRDDFRATAARIVASLDAIPGRIRVIGHTDSSPIRTVRFPSNWHLSVERAKAVADVLRRGLAQPERVAVEGKGAEEPVASNDTAEGRARNRRVEIIVLKAR